MKKIRSIISLLMLHFCFLSGAAQFQSTDFITTWETNRNNSIIIPGEGNYNVYFESITPAGHSGHRTSLSGTSTITLPVAGTYKVAIQPISPAPFHKFTASANMRSLLLSIEQWGTIAWSSFASAFRGCSNLKVINATDTPDLSRVTDMSYMFEACSNFTGSASMRLWNTGNVILMNNLFNGAFVFNAPIESWNMSNVENINSMFTSAYLFNQPISGWDVSKVKNMSYVFNTARAFNQNLGSWNIKSVTPTNMFAFFRASGMDCFRLTQTLDGWANNPETPNGINFNISGGGGTPTYSNSLPTNGYTQLTAKQWNLSTVIYDQTGACASNIILPVTLVNFSAAIHHQHVQLNWSTANEQNSKGFYIERSSDGNTWSNIGFIKTAAISGNSNNMLNYLFIDENPLNAQNFYRLKQVDIDLRFEYSSIARLMFSTSEVILFPNPTKDVVTIQGIPLRATISLFNASGQQLYHLKKNRTTTLTVSLQQYAKGIYYLQVREEDGRTRQYKVIKSL